MFGHTSHEKLAAKAAPLARDLRDQYGLGAVEVCRAALTSPNLPGERRRVIRIALQMLDGSLAMPPETLKLDPVA